MRFFSPHTLFITHIQIFHLPSYYSFFFIGKNSCCFFFLISCLLAFTALNFCYVGFGVHVYELFRGLSEISVCRSNISSAFKGFIMLFGSHAMQFRREANMCMSLYTALGNFLNSLPSGIMLSTMPTENPFFGSSRWKDGILIFMLVFPYCCASLKLVPAFGVKP